MFFEQIEFTELSEDRLRTFVEIFDSSAMSVQLWNKLSRFLFDNNERKRKTTKIIVSGDDRLNQLGEKPNNIGKDDDRIISPPLNSPIDSSSLLSYSVCIEHSVLVTKSGSLLGIDNNNNCQITSSLKKREISQFT